MTRDEFKAKLTGLVDELIPTDGELSEEDENKLGDHFGDVANDFLNEDDDDEDKDEGSVETGKGE